MSEAKLNYSDALKDRRAGIVSSLGSEATFLEVKPEFYADARLLSEDALRTFQELEITHPPYGLVDRQNNALDENNLQRSPWLQLTSALRATGHAVFEHTVPTVQTFPYHEVLAVRLGSTIPRLKPIDSDRNGLDTLRNVVTPGGELNAPLFTSLIRRLPAIQKLHGSTTDREVFARKSVSLLREPLSHPQQWAAAFVYSLGSMGELVSPKFLNDDLALSYTKVERLEDKTERLAWAIPTEEFTTRHEIKVANRLLGSETDSEGAHFITYPVGTKLKDIKVDEPTLGCPGDQLARAMWQRTIDVVVAEALWDKDLLTS